MDSYREHPSDFDLPASSDTAAASDVESAIGTDERRMHVRAYNYWVSLLDGRDFPSIEDLEPSNVEDFAGNSVLLDFTCGRDNPAIPYIGAGIRDECGLSDDARTISDVPSRSLLSRLTDHYMQIIANRAPVGFEAEYVNQRDENSCYRGILMPFSSDGDAIDFIYGVINWKTVNDASQGQTAVPVMEPEAVEPISELLLEEEVAPEAVEAPIAAEPTGIEPQEHPTWDDGPSAESAFDPIVAEHAPPPMHFSWEDAAHADGDTEELPELVLDENAGLADRLWAARETAESVKTGEGRTRVALYRALSLAYDVAVVAQQNPQDYAELLEESGVKMQARAPMTPIVKLVFGIDYDKARLTEFAAALSYAQRQEIALSGFQDFIEKQSGGLKALVAAERHARRPETRPDTRGEAARAKLRAAPAISFADISADEEFAVVITRRGADGTHEPIASHKGGFRPSAGLSVSRARVYRPAAALISRSTITS
jgi:hypothetical protein